jgi:hypothetical protein
MLICGTNPLGQRALRRMPSLATESSAQLKLASFTRRGGAGRPGLLAFAIGRVNSKWVSCVPKSNGQHVSLRTSKRPENAPKSGLQLGLLMTLSRRRLRAGSYSPLALRPHRSSFPVHKNVLSKWRMPLPLTTPPILQRDRRARPAVLVERFHWARLHSVEGIHLVTSSTSRSIPFYRRSGFRELRAFPWNSGTSVCMGRKL